MAKYIQLYMYINDDTFHLVSVGEELAPDLADT